MSRPATSRKTPLYRCQRRTQGRDLGFVEINGHRHYLGPHNTPQSLERYHRLIAEWMASGQTVTVNPQEITIVELSNQFFRWAGGYYVRDGEPTHELANITLALRPLKELYGHSKAADFGPRALKAIREKIIADGGSRRYVNRQIGIIKRMFKWAVAEELIPSAIHHGLQAVTGLKFGRSGAREGEPVLPAADELIEPVKQRAPRQIKAMIELQLLTGARSGEIVIMRPCDVNRDAPVWQYRPAVHKTQYLGRERVILLGPLAQNVLAPFLVRPPETYCFSPAEVERDRRRQLHESRTTPLSCGNRPGSNRKERPGRKPGDHYTTQSYGRAIRYLCEKCFVPPEPLAAQEGETEEQLAGRLTDKQKKQLQQWRRRHYWHPHQLRHNYATHVRKQYGLEAAQILLGHSTADVTQVYAERDMDRATQVAAKIG